MYIKLNFIYLQKHEKLTKDEFGEKFKLKNNVFGGYIRENKCNNADFLIDLSNYYNIPVADFKYKDISKTYYLNQHNNFVNEDSLIFKKNERKLKKYKQELENKKIEIEKLKLELKNKQLQLDILEKPVKLENLTTKLIVLENAIKKIEEKMDP